MRFALLGVWLVAVPLLLARGMTWIARHVQNRHDPIDRLIEQKGAKPITGMETTDWTLVARAGEKRWREALAAQTRYVQVPAVSIAPDDEDEAIGRRTPLQAEDGTIWRAGSRSIN